jgi:hypothetical protein
MRQGGFTNPGARHRVSTNAVGKFATTVVDTIVPGLWLMVV